MKPGRSGRQRPDEPAVDPMGNLFETADDLAEELIEPLLESGAVRVERIVSRGHASPPGFWYDQDEDEWVVLLRGSAVVRIDGREPLSMRPGDWILLPAHRRHRVDATDPDGETVWLAVFMAGRPDTDQGT